MAITNWGCYLKNSVVNSGTAVFLRDVEITIGLKKLVKATPVVGYSTGDTGSATTRYRYYIATGDRAGVENPIITIRGVIDTTDSTSNVATERLLKEFWREEVNQTTLTIGIGSAGEDNYAFAVPYQISDYQGPNDTGLGSTDNINVEISSITLSISSAAEHGHLINYELQLIEVQ